jgi:Uma2 family endonuclease
MDRVLNRKLTYEDYAAIPADGMTYQIVDGELIATPAPNPFHQRASKRLQRQLEAYFEETGRGEVFDAPIDVILSPHDITQPDLVVVADATTVTARGIEGPPLLVVEVLSPASVKYDRQAKARRYALFGIAHYWILDPDARRLECFSLRDGVYQLAASATAPETLAVSAWAGLTIDLSMIWRETRS